MSRINKLNSDDPRFEQWAQSILEAEESDFSGNDDSDNDPDYVSEHESDSEIEWEPETVALETTLDVSDTTSQNAAPSSEHRETPTSTPRTYYGKNRYKWTADAPPSNVRTRSHNIISHLPGVIGPAKSLGKLCLEKSAWECLITSDILDEIVLRSNEKLARIRTKYADGNRTDLRDLDVIELKAFIGLLFYSAIFKSNNEDLNSIFATDGTGREVFRCTMSIKRFQVLLTALRFDDQTTREDRKKTDKLAPISSIFNKFTENSKKNFSIGQYACIDEMLIGFRGRCVFRMYMPQKPRKYGLKIMALTDARTYYFLDGYVYTGAGSDGQTLSEEERKFNKPTQSVLRLVRSIEGTNRNVTADNWFTSLEVITELQKRGLTYVGTVKKNKREIPASFLPNKSRLSDSSLFAFGDRVTLVSYVPKPRKAVLLMSSMHYSKTVNNETKKPEIIEFYNETKGGVDALDEKCTVYSTHRRSRRWPLTIFYTILDISSVNSFIIYSCLPGNPHKSRYEFIKSLARQLVQDHMERRLTTFQIPRQLRYNIASILQKDVPEPSNDVLTKRVRCSKCPRSLDRKTKIVCASCKAPICHVCETHICKDCL